MFDKSEMPLSITEINSFSIVSVIVFLRMAEISLTGQNVLKHQGDILTFRRNVISLVKTKLQLVGASDQILTFKDL